MTRQQIINEIANDGVGFVAELCHNPADQRAAAAMPFQIDSPVRCFAMDLGPAVRTAWSLVFGGDQIKSPELGIAHDFFPQRSASGCDDLNHRLHCSVGSAGNHSLCNVSLNGRAQSLSMPKRDFSFS